MTFNGRWQDWKRNRNCQRPLNYWRVEVLEKQERATLACKSTVQLHCELIILSLWFVIDLSFMIVIDCWIILCSVDLRSMFLSVLFLVSPKLRLFSNLVVLGNSCFSSNLVTVVTDHLSQFNPDKSGYWWDKMMIGCRDKINNGDPMWRIEDWIVQSHYWRLGKKLPWQMETRDKTKSRTFPKNITQINKSKTLITPFSFM